MPRRKEPKRELRITMDEESVRDALAQWVQEWHGFDIDTKTIEIDIDTESGSIRRVSAIKKPTKGDEDVGTTDRGKAMGVLSGPKGPTAEQPGPDAGHGSGGG